MSEICHNLCGGGGIPATTMKDPNSRLKVELSEVRTLSIEVTNLLASKGRSGLIQGLHISIFCLLRTSHPLSWIIIPFICRIWGAKEQGGREPPTKYNEKQTTDKNNSRSFLCHDPRSPAQPNGWPLLLECMIVTRLILISGVLVNIIRADIGQQDIIDTGYCTSGSLQHSYNNLL